MKLLNQLMKEADPLKGFATELENFIGKVDSESVDLAELPPMITTIKNAIPKMRQVAEQLDRMSDHNIEIVSSRDAATLSFLKSNYDGFVQNSERLSVVLGELVKMLDLDGTGIDIYILHYVSDAMESFRALLEEIKDIDYSRQ
jgi:hypothetical protein